MRTELVVGLVGLMLLPASAGAQPVAPGAQASMPSPYAPLFGDGLASRVGRFGDTPAGSYATHADPKRLAADKEYLVAHAKSVADLVAFAKKCRRLIGPPSYCDIPEMQQLAWTKEQ